MLHSDQLDQIKWTLFSDINMIKITLVKEFLFNRDQFRKACWQHVVSRERDNWRFTWNLFWNATEHSQLILFFSTCFSMLTDDQSAFIDLMMNSDEEIITFDNSENELIILTLNEENIKQSNSFEWEWWSYSSETFLKSSSSFKKQRRLYIITSQSTRILLNEQNMNLINLTDQSNLIIINIVQKQNELMIA